MITAVDNGLETKSQQSTAVRKLRALCSSARNLNYGHIKSGKCLLPQGKFLTVTMVKTLLRLIQWPSLTEEQT